MVVAGDVTLSRVKSLCDQWFTSIPEGPKNRRNLSAEPKQSKARFLELASDVPVSAFYQVFHMPSRYQLAYHQADLVSDILGVGKSSRLYQRLVKEQPLFSSISTHVTGSLDPGLMVIQGKLIDGVSCEDGHKAVREEIGRFLADGIDDTELNKVKNQAESNLVFSEVNLLNRAMNLAVATVAGNTDYVNQEPEIIQGITAEEIMNIAQNMLKEENSSTLYYRKKSA
jgi:predicted Zn-dependent peptidase